MGKPNLIPLFQPVSVSPYQAASGNGSNTTYSIIGFVSVTISQAEANIDATSVIPVTTPAGTGQSSFGTSPTTFVSAKLSY
jgi:hypothetical protein